MKRIDIGKICLFLFILMGLTIIAINYCLGYFYISGLLFLMSLVFLVLILAVAKHEWGSAKFDIFQPIIFTGFLFFFPNFVIKTWTIIWVNEEGPMIKNLWDPDFSISLALFVGVISYGCLIFGYYFCPVQKWAQRQFLKFKFRIINIKLITLPSLLLFFIGIFSSYYLITTGQGLGYSDVEKVSPFMHLFQQISKFNLYAFFIFLYCYFIIRGREASWKIHLAFMLVCQLILGFFIGSRGYLFLTGLVAIAAMQYSGYLRGSLFRTLKGGTFLLILLFLGIVFVTPFREIKYKLIGFDRPYSLEESFLIYKEVTKSENISSFGDAITYLWELATDRANNMTSLATVLERADKVKDLEVAYGIDKNMLWEFIWGLVPRFLYPDKPIMSDFAVKFGIIYHDNPIYMRSWSNPTIIGDLYRNAGYLGIILGMIFLGMFLRVIYVCLAEHARNPLSFMVYVFSIININFEGTYIGIFHGLIRLWIIMLIFSKIFGLMTRSRGTISKSSPVNQIGP